MGWIDSHADVRQHVPRPHCVSVKPGNQTGRRHQVFLFGELDSVVIIQTVDVRSRARMITATDDGIVAERTVAMYTEHSWPWVCGWSGLRYKQIHRN